MGIRLDIRCPRFPRPVGLPVDLPPHAPCHASPVVERQDYVSALCSLAHRTGALRLDAELHCRALSLQLKILARQDARADSARHLILFFIRLPMPQSLYTDKKRF